MTHSSIIDDLRIAEGTRSEPAGGKAVDSLLVAAAARGDSESFRILVESYSAPLLRFCTRILQCPEDARDVCQDTFVRAWCALQGGYVERGRFRAWLWRIALNLCRDHCRAGRVRIRSEALVQENAAPPGVRSPSEAAASAADLARLAEGLNAIPESLRLPLWLCCVEELSQAECAAMLGISVRAVEGRIHRGRRRLTDWWEKSGRR